MSHSHLLHSTSSPSHSFPPPPPLFIALPYTARPPLALPCLSSPFILWSHSFPHPPLPLQSGLLGLPSSCWACPPSAHTHWQLSSSARPLVKKKAALCLLRLFRKNPDIISTDTCSVCLDRPNSHLLHLLHKKPDMMSNGTTRGEFHVQHHPSTSPPGHCTIATPCQPPIPIATHIPAHEPPLPLLIPLSQTTAHNYPLPILSPSCRPQRMASLLEERSLSVLLAAMSLLVALVAANPEAYLCCVPKCVKVLERLAKCVDISQDYTYYAIPSPWLQVCCVCVSCAVPSPRPACRHASASASVLCHTHPVTLAAGAVVKCHSLPWPFRFMSFSHLLPPPPLPPPTLSFHLIVPPPLFPSIRFSPHPPPPPLNTCPPAGAAGRQVKVLRYFPSIKDKFWDT
ncbi:unnamed protein product [Closterium sp. NIES-54]